MDHSEFKDSIKDNLPDEEKAKLMAFEAECFNIISKITKSKELAAFAVDNVCQLYKKAEAMFKKYDADNGIIVKTAEQFQYMRELCLLTTIQRGTDIANDLLEVTKEIDACVVKCQGDMNKIMEKLKDNSNDSKKYKAFKAPDIGNLWE